MSSNKSSQSPLPLKEQLVSPEQALKGRAEYIFPVDACHRLFGGSLQELQHYPKRIVLGLGCFWGAERLFWQRQGVLMTAVGYAGGYTLFPTYEEVCSGLTGHAEVVAVAYDPDQVGLEQLLALFWERHDPTQGMRQGNDKGSQYRSAIYCLSDDDLVMALNSKARYQSLLSQSGFGEITTEIKIESAFYFAEPFHQQYLDANPNGYCGLKGTGVNCG